MSVERDRRPRLFGGDEMLEFRCLSRGGRGWYHATPRKARARWIARDSKRGEGGAWGEHRAPGVGGGGGPRKTKTGAGGGRGRGGGGGRDIGGGVAEHKGAGRIEMSILQEVGSEVELEAV